MPLSFEGEPFEPQLKKRINRVMGEEAHPLAAMLSEPNQFMSENGTEFFAVPKDQLPDLAKRYIQWIEMSPTKETCKCEWAVHPDDAGVDVTLCRFCGLTEDEHSQAATGSDVVVCDEFRAATRRLRMKEEHPLCPVHTKVGRLTGFFEWVFLVDSQG
jgi:hypothetical protein